MPELNHMLNRPLALTWERLGTPDPTAARHSRPGTVEGGRRPGTAASDSKGGGSGDKLSHRRPSTVAGPRRVVINMAEKPPLPDDIPNQKPLLQQRQSGMSSMFRKGALAAEGEADEAKKVSILGGNKSFAGGVRAILDLKRLVAQGNPASPVKTTPKTPGTRQGASGYWEPKVKMFVEVDQDDSVQFPSLASRLLKVKCPTDVTESLTDAARQVAESIGNDHIWTTGNVVKDKRPAMAGRYLPKGKPLTLLNIAAEEVHPAFLEEAKPVTPRPMAEKGQQVVKLNVQVGTESRRNNIRFSLRSAESMAKKPQAGADTARALIFEHVDGCQVCNDLYQHYRLPNGKLAHFCDAGPGLKEEREVPQLKPLAQPQTLSELLQDGLPTPPSILKRVLQPQVFYPPLVFKPLAPRPPLPLHHILPVQDPNKVTRESFSDFVGLPLTLTVTYSVVEKTVEEQVVELSDCFNPEKDNWCFSERRVLSGGAHMQEADARDLHDTPETSHRAVATIFPGIAKRDRFTTAVKRVLKKFGGAQYKNYIVKIQEAATKHFLLADSVYAYYAVRSGGTISYDVYQDFLSDCNIADEASERCTLDHCLEIFNCTKTKEVIKAEKEAVKVAKAAMEAELKEAVEEGGEEEEKGKKKKEKGKKKSKSKGPGGTYVENIHVLTRTLWLEVLLLLAAAKYNFNDQFKKIRCQDFASAFEFMMEQNFKASLPASLTQPRSVFRKSRLYTKEMSQLLNQHQKRLRLLYNTAITPPEQFPRPPTMPLSDFLKLLRCVHYVYPEAPTVSKGDVDGSMRVGELEATVSFLQGRMLVVTDTIDTQLRMMSLTFTDFVEALARVADMTSVVSEEELRELRYPGVVDYMLVCETNEDPSKLFGPSGCPHPPRRKSASFLAPKTRPLHMKMRVMIDAMSQFVFPLLDPQAGGTYSDKELMLRLDKLNKELIKLDDSKKRDDHVTALLRI